MGYSLWMKNKPVKKWGEEGINMGEKITPIRWGNSSDGSISGIVLVKTDNGKRLFLGSRIRFTTEQEDTNYIADWGSEITKNDLKSMLEMLEDD